MTGFIRGVFGGKKKDPPPQPAAPDSGYYLDDKLAKSLGDTEKMNRLEQVRKTFPKTATSVGKDQFTGASTATPTPAPSPAIEAITDSVPTLGTEAVKERRKSDNNLNMFRQMAKDIRK
jgi:hypothetical protein